MEPLTGIPLIVDAITSVFAACIGMVTDVVEQVVSNPLLLFFAVLPLVGIGIGIFARLKRT